MNSAVDSSGEIPQEPGIGSPTGEFSCVRLGTRTWHVVEDPGNFCGAEVCRHGQARRMGEAVYPAVLGEGIRYLLSARVLPDDGVIERPPRCSFPDDCRLALIRDANCSDLGCGDFRVG